MKKILFIIPSLNIGGSERVIVNILTILNRKKYKITLLMIKKEGEYLKLLPDDINIIDLNKKRTRYAIFHIIKFIKMESPDIVFTTLGHLNLLISITISLMPKKICFIARESSIVSQNIKTEKYPFIFKLLYRYFYNNFDKIIAQSIYMRNDLISNFRIKKDKIHVIYNPINSEKIYEALKEHTKFYFDKSKINLLYVGRLEKIKDCESILLTLEQLGKQYNLTIVGDGSQKESLIQLANTLHLDHRVVFVGFQENPYPFIQNADCLLITSMYEGFPNVVLEANLLGKPVFGYNCPGGLSEIIQNGLNGYIIDERDPKKLAKAIDIYYNKHFNSEAITKITLEKFSLIKIGREYECYFEA